MASIFSRLPLFLVHGLVWVLLGLMLLVFSPLNMNVTLPAEFWIKQGILFCLWIGAFYINILIWVPKFLFENKINLFVLSAFGTTLVVIALIWLTEYSLNLPTLMHQAFHPEKHIPGESKSVPLWALTFPFFSTLMALGIGTTIAAVQKSQKDTLLRQEEALLRKTLEQQRTNSELSFLKAQINPHFFFNTLNNIYALTMLNVESSRQALLKLSRMMRYVLYDTQKDMVLLSQEIAFIQDYIELMQLRLTDKVEISFQKPTPLRDVQIAPMILLPFVENAFKHGVSSLHASRISIALQQQPGQLEVKVRNTMFSEQNKSLEQGNGIGLVNTRRRLDLLYPDHYNLSVAEDTTQHEYLVHLTLDLS
ncbi:sensor histidine kinase [Rhodocytophaga rosea]|nr:histidine kinase [Rhodocytophaga rosea]